MAARFINIDRRTPMLMPENIQEWVPENHISRFIVDAVELLDLSSFHINWRGTGSEQYPPAMMLELLIYCYATGRFASRRIEEATYSDVAVRFICANTHPDHDTICKFRTDNRAALSECFVKVLAMAGETGILKKVGGVSVDGTKIKAGASRHAAVSYERAGQMIEQLRLEIDDLIHKAEDADSTPLDDGLSIPEEISLREERRKRLEKARAAIEKRCQAERQAKQAEYERKLAERGKRRAAGKRAGGKPKPPSAAPPAKKQHNFTDFDNFICGVTRRSRLNGTWSRWPTISNGYFH